MSINGSSSDLSHQRVQAAAAPWMGPMHQYPAGGPAAMVMPHHMMPAPPPRHQFVPQHFTPAYAGFPHMPPYNSSNSNSQIGSDNGENKTVWVGDLLQWMDENYLHSCFANTGEVVS